jgi:hypothetical protein
MCTERSSQLIIALRQKRRNFQDFRREVCLKGLFESSATDAPEHVKTLAGWFQDPESLAESMRNLADQLLSKYAESWQRSIQEANGLVTKYCPAWEHAKSTLASEKLVAELLNNPYYPKLSPLSTLLSNQLKYV